MATNWLHQNTLHVRTIYPSTNWLAPLKEGMDNEDLLTFSADYPAQQYCKLGQMVTLDLWLQGPLGLLQLSLNRKESKLAKAWITDFF